MNETTATAAEPVTTAAECCAEIEQYARRNPAAAILVALGTGLALGLLVRGLRPEATPRNRLARLLGDLEGRLRDARGPALRQAGALASDGLAAVQNGEARIERLFGDTTRRVRRLFF